MFTVAAEIEVDVVVCTIVCRLKKSPPTDDTQQTVKRSCWGPYLQKSNRWDYVLPIHSNTDLVTVACIVVHV